MVGDTPGWIIFEKLSIKNAKVEIRLYLQILNGARSLEVLIIAFIENLGKSPVFLRRMKIYLSCPETLEHSKRNTLNRLGEKVRLV